MPHDAIGEIMLRLIPKKFTQDGREKSYRIQDDVVRYHASAAAREVVEMVLIVLHPGNSSLSKMERDGKRGLLVHKGLLKEKL